VIRFYFPLASSTNWDQRWLGLAQYISTFSKDPSTKCGGVIVRPDKTLASIGFNGFPKGIEDWSHHYENREKKYRKIIHAEINALHFAREQVVGYTLYTWPFAPCEACALHIIQKGIARVVAPKETPDRWKESVRNASALFTEAGVALYLI